MEEVIICGHHNTDGCKPVTHGAVFALVFIFVFIVMMTWLVVGCRMWLMENPLACPSCRKCFILHDRNGIRQGRTRSPGRVQPGIHGRDNAAVVPITSEPQHSVPTPTVTAQSPAIVDDGSPPRPRTSQASHHSHTHLHTIVVSPARTTQPNTWQCRVCNHTNPQSALACELCACIAAEQ